MSCTGLPELRLMLAQLLANEKEDIRVWLRAEMERLVGPNLDTIFKRLETKLIGGLGGHCSSIVNQSTNVLPQSSSTFIIQPPNLILPSNTLYISSLNPTSFYLNPQYVQSPQFTSSPVPAPPVSITNSQIGLPNELTNGAFTNVQSLNPINTIETTNANGSNHEGHFPQSLSVPNVVNESQPSNQLNCDEDEEDENDDCVIIDQDDDDDDGDSVKLMIDEEYAEESDQPLKKAKLDTTAQAEVHNNQDCFQNQTQPKQVTNQIDKQCITVTLQCTEPDCWDTFAPQKLNQHMLEKHHLGPHRCLAKDCRQSFNDKRPLSEHIKQHYQHTTQLQCAKCVKNFTTYHLLSNHNIRQHQVGQFECAFPSCLFTGKSKNNVYSHYTQQHKPTLNCQQSGCSYQTITPSILKTHQRIHSGIKPYRCKWPRCEHAAAQKSHAMVHIRSHIARYQNSDPNGAQLDPNDYLEVMHHLL